MKIKEFRRLTHKQQLEWVHFYKPAYRSSVLAILILYGFVIMQMYGIITIMTVPALESLRPKAMELVIKIAKLTGTVMVISVAMIFLDFGFFITQVYKEDKWFKEIGLRGR